MHTRPRSIFEQGNAARHISIIGMFHVNGCIHRPSDRIVWPQFTVSLSYLATVYWGQFVIRK